MAARRAPGEGQETLDAFKPSLPNGVPLNEAVSILIKEMRRGKEVEAVYWAREIEARFHKYVWRRLAIFAAEDVGIANPNLIVQIRALWESYVQIDAESSAKGRPDGNLIVMAVMLCARSPKNREVDNMKNVIGALVKEAHWQPEIPEYAIDGHTAAGREANPEFRTDRGRALHWFTIGSHVENETGPRDAKLWHFRNMARRGIIDTDQVEGLAKDWDEKGYLEYGLEGILPRVPDDAPKD